MGIFGGFGKEQKKTKYICARCKKELTDEESQWIGAHRFCKACATPPKASVLEQHLRMEAEEAGYQAYMDYARGPYTPEEAYSRRGFVKGEDGGWVYGKLVGHCSHGDEGAGLDQDLVRSSEKERAICSLREKIICSIEKEPAVQYEVASLLWDKAAKCFPNDASFQWDGAWFKLDLTTRKIMVQVSTYPNAVGASREDKFSVSASEFHRIANEFGFEQELRALESRGDWDALFDDRLMAAISEATASLKKKKEERDREVRLNRAIVIPDGSKGTGPSMDLVKVTLELRQRYADSSVVIFPQNGSYRIEYKRVSHLSYDVKNRSRDLTPAEAAWMERQVRKTVEDKDRTTWQSIPGGDSMTVEIQEKRTTLVRIDNGQPQTKYTRLKDELEDLVEYGSISSSEKT